LGFSGCGESSIPLHELTQIAYRFNARNSKVQKMKLKNFCLVLVGAALTAGATNASAQYFTQGDLVVSVYGNPSGTNYTDGNITPVTLQEYSLTTPTSASLVLTDQLPTSGTNGNVGIVGEYGSSSEGALQLTGNGQYLTIQGYDPAAAAMGIDASSNAANNTSFALGTLWSTSTIALAQATDTNVPRVAATIDANGVVNTSTVLNDIYNTNNPRSIYSANGTTFYISGQGAGASDEGGIYLSTFGTNTVTGGAAPTPIYNAVSTRNLTEFAGNLYYSADQNSSKKGTQTGIFEYTGTPTTSQGASTGTLITPATAVVNSATVNLSPDGFVFANATTLYVADTGDPKAGGTGDGGIQKWENIGTALAPNWVLEYTLTDPNFVSSSLATTASHGETGFAQMALQVVNGNVDIYATSYTAGDDDANGLYAIVDNLGATTLPTGGSAENFTEIASAAGNSNAGGADDNFKGVSFAPESVPEPSTWGLAIAGGLGMLAMCRRRRWSTSH
jgi:hypothetical protein